jgi:hypothetical protein
MLAVRSGQLAPSSPAVSGGDGDGSGLTPIADLTSNEGATMSIKDTARKLPGVAAIEGAVSGAIAREQDLPIADYDKQSATDIASKLKGLSQHDLRMIDAYERKDQNRSTITDKIAKLTGDEPWSGYDEQSVDAIATAIDAADAQTAKKVKAYERDHKGRVGVIDSADKRIARAS